MNRNGIFYLKLFLLIFFIVFTISYTIFQSKKIITGPVIEIVYPENGYKTNERLIEIKGKAKNISSFKINDALVLIEQNGNFSRKLLLGDGYNIIKVSAEDKFGKKIEKIVELICDCKE